jgi:hypothetical protein
MFQVKLDTPNAAAPNVLSQYCTLHSNIYDGPWSSGRIRSRFSPNYKQFTQVYRYRVHREHRKSGTPFQCVLLRLNLSSAFLPNVPRIVLYSVTLLFGLSRRLEDLDLCPVESMFNFDLGH